MHSSRYSCDDVGWLREGGMKRSLRLASVAILGSDPGLPRDGGWQLGACYLRRGLTLARRQPGLYLLITVVFVLPALLAAWLVSSAREPTPWQQAAILGLPWLTVVLGTVAIMVAVGCHAHGRPLSLGRTIWYSLSWVPRYLWTNVHTSLIFWGPLAILLALRAWQERALPSAGADGARLAILWWLLIGAAALYLHTRTLLAPFLAVHADLPGTLAALEAWRLSGPAFAACLSVLLVASLPVVLPLGLLTFGVVCALPDEARQASLPALPDLVYAGIQVVRPLLIPATYTLYTDLWDAERARRQAEAIPPARARVLLLLTRPLPRLGRWPWTGQGG
jgi:hypothetical protein